ncbi:uncharacterized protein LOC134819401 [Bolinopsis microptera]|uniref:uncharacterized protein LOC134819401 n=1 Tax=Bolinopsis microptera TaxID=2820187 RepID=UPI003079DA19
MELFSDLNIMCPKAGQEDVYYKLCLQLGYRTIAFNHVIDMSQALVKNQLKLPKCNLKKCDDLQVLHRITLVCSDPSHLRALKNPQLKKFDIIALSPKSEELLSQSISNFPNSFQILSLDFTQKLPFRLKHTHLHPCKLNNVVFEICYVSAIKDSSSCRNTVSNSKDLNWSSRGRGFIISSGAEDPLFLRGPYDVINLVTLFGIEFKSAKAAISTNCEIVFLKGLTRTQTFNGILQKNELATIEDSIIAFPKQLILTETSEQPSLSKKLKTVL